MKCETNPNNCPIEVTLSLIGGKYKPVILWFLIDHPLHYAELQRLIPKATPKMLSQQLHDLENSGIIHREVEPEKLEQILEAAHVAPTAANLQPVHLLVVQSEEGLAKISKAAGIYGAPLAIIVCADHNKAWTRPFDKKQSGDIDASILTDHMMLQATELGLGTVWVCYFQPDVLKQEFNLPANLEPVNILVVGYSDEEDADTNRFDSQRIPMSQLVSYENL